MTNDESAMNNGTAQAPKLLWWITGAILGPIVLAVWLADQFATRVWPFPRPDLPPPAERRTWWKHAGGAAALVVVACFISLILVEENFKLDLRTSRRKHSAQACV